MKIATLHDLFVHELKDVLSAEKQLLQALPSMSKLASSDELRTAMETHLEQTEEHVERLKKVFEMLDVAPRSQKCKGMEGLLAEGKDLGEEDIEGEILDAALIGAAQRVEHYEIAAYGTLAAFANALGLEEIKQLLETTLQEEKETDLLLSKLAEGGINMMAVDGDSDEEESAASGSARKTASKQSSGGSGRSATKTARRR